MALFIFRDLNYFYTKINFCHNCQCLQIFFILKIQNLPGHFSSQFLHVLLLQQIIIANINEHTHFSDAFRWEENDSIDISYWCYEDYKKPRINASKDVHQPPPFCIPFHISVASALLFSRIMKIARNNLQLLHVFHHTVTVISILVLNRHWISLLSKACHYLYLIKLHSWFEICLFS